MITVYPIFGTHIGDLVEAYMLALQQKKFYHTKGKTPEFICFNCDIYYTKIKFKFFF